ncbi:MAG TPA: hypothetical protein VE993_08600, partial [Stellaceae bacterium]|nr:hypothetical protein [Stellaceae bacterium]
AHQAAADPARLGNWIITPQLGAQETYTDNVLLTPTNRRSDLISLIAPSLSINGAGARLQGSFTYSPTAYLYALTPRLDAVGQNLYAAGTATLVPNNVFVDAHAYASLQPTFPGLATGGVSLSPGLVGTNLGGIGPGLSTIIPTSQLTQVTGFDASPYVVGHFDGFGTGELRYTVSDTNFGGGKTSPFAPPGFAVQNTNQVINEGTAAFLTGENFGPFASRVLLDAAQSSGTGVLRASQTVAVDDSAYALTRRIYALGSIGYENLRFGGLPPTHITDAIWGIGTRLTPRPNASLTVLYGHRNGVTAPYISLYYALTGRTTVSVTYSEGLTTTNQEIADTLAVSAAGPTGQTVDARTLLPTAIVNPVLGLQGGLFRSSQLNGTVTYTLSRNTISLSAYRYANALVAQSTPGIGVSQKTIGGNAVWTRTISPRTTANLGVGYSQFNFPTQPGFAEDLVTTGLSVTYLLSRSLTGWAGYSFFHTASPQPQLRLLSNVVFVGLSKVF